MKLRSLRVRLTLWSLLLFCLAQAIVGCLFYGLASRWLQDQVDYSLLVSAIQVQTILSEEGDQPQIDDIDFQFNAGSPELQAAVRDHMFFVRLIDRQNGTILNTSNPNQVPVTLHAQRVDAAYETFRLAHDQLMRVYTLVLEQKPQWALQVGISLAQMHSNQDVILRLLWMAFGLSALFAVLIGWFVGNRALIPIDHITRTTQEIHATDLTSRLDLQASDDELAQLARTFNAMLDRIEKAFHQQRQFTTDAAHELRTPLSIMQTGLDVVLSQERTASEYQAALGNMREEVHRLTQLTHSLLILARADTAELPFNRQLVELSLLLNTLLDQLSILAGQKQIVMQRTITPDLSIEGDQDRLVQVALNLIENAIKYTPEGGRIEVSAAAGEATVQFTVKNTGTLIAEADLPHLFDRFYRVDRARNRQQNGFGLGLAIAKKIVELHGGSIEASSCAQDGIAFTVTLPRRAHRIEPA